MDYTEYQIALSPDLDITPEEFASAWNHDPDAHDHEPTFSSEKSSQFIDPILVAALLSVPASVASSTLYDLLKSVVTRLHKEKGQTPVTQRHVHIEQTTKSDGTKILVIDIVEQ